MSWPLRTYLKTRLECCSHPILAAWQRSRSHPESQELRGDPAMKIQGLPAGFIFPAQPVLRLKPPAGTDWVHEIKHDGYRMIVLRDGFTVRLFSRNAYDWTARLSAIATAARRIKPRALRLTARQLCSGLTACHGSRSCPVGRVLEPQSSTACDGARSLVSRRDACVARVVATQARWPIGFFRPQRRHAHG